MLVKAPFTLPADFLKRFGYRGGRRFVAIYWEPCGDESCYADGVLSACGTTDNWLYLDFVRSGPVSSWLAAAGLSLGSSDGEAVDWLVADALTGAVYGGPRREARAAVARQELQS